MFGFSRKCTSNAMKFMRVMFSFAVECFPFKIGLFSFLFRFVNAVVTVAEVIQSLEILHSFLCCFFILRKLHAYRDVQNYLRALRPTEGNSFISLLCTTFMYDARTLSEIVF